MKKSFKFSLAAVAAALSFLSGQIQAAEQTVKYVFLFIGDGMSMPQRMLANEYSEKLGKGTLPAGILL